MMAVRYVLDTVAYGLIFSYAMVLFVRYSIVPMPSEERDGVFYLAICLAALVCARCAVFGLSR